MNIVKYFQTLDEAGKQAFADKVGTSVGYLRAHILSAKGGFRKRPKDELIVRLVMASEGQVSLDEAIDYFLVSPVKKLAAELAAPSLLKHRSAAVALPVNCVDNDSGAGL